MQNQNVGPLLTTLILKADINELNQALTRRLVSEVCEHHHRISALEQQNQEILLKLDSFENQLQENQESINFHVRHLVCKNEDLENRLAFLEPQD